MDNSFDGFFFFSNYPSNIVIREIVYRLRKNLRNFKQAFTVFIDRFKFCLFVYLFIYLFGIEYMRI